jgi:signal transduction histidine kinase
MRASFEERLRERARIGRELHDRLLQNISGFAMQLDGVSKIVAKQPEHTKERLCGLRREAEQWLHEARESVWDRRPAPDEQQDFCEAVRWAGEQITHGTPVQFSMTISGSRQAIPPTVQEQLLKTVQEALRNAVRHAEATEVHIDICVSMPSKMRICIRDNWIRFRPGDGLAEIGKLGFGNHTGAR